MQCRLDFITMRNVHVCVICDSGFCRKIDKKTGCSKAVTFLGKIKILPELCYMHW